MAKYNTVPLGQAGTGGAFTLGANAAIPVYQQQVALGNQERDLEAQKLAKSFRDNMLAASDGKLFAKEMGNLEQNHIKQGMDYRSQGFDIYNPDPNNAQQMAASQQYLADRRMIENLRAYRKGIEDDFTKGAELLSKGVEGEYDPQTVAARNRVVSEGSLMDLYNKGERLPALQKRFSLGDNLKDLKAPTIQRESVENGLIRTEEFVDEPKARNLVISAMMNKPEGQAQLAKVTKGVPVQELNALPSTLSEIENRVNEDYAGNPAGLEYLAANQIKVGSDKYNQFVKKQAKDLYDAKKELNTLVDRGVAQISQGIKTIDKSKPTMTEGEKKRLALSEANLALSRQRLALDKQKQAEGGTKVKDTPELQRQVDIEEMINGVPGSGERIGAVMAGRGGYQGKLGIEDKGTTITFTIPKRVVKSETVSTDQYGEEVTKPRSVVTPAKTITVRKGNEEDKVKLNEILSDITGEKITYRSYKTGNASGKVSKPTTAKPKATTQPVKKSINRSELASKAAASGYSVSEYEKLLKSKGVEIK